MYYDDVEYANKRLSGTLVSLLSDGSPFVVASVMKEAGGIFCYGDNLVTKTTEITPLSNINLTPVSLGFFNYETKMYYSCRRPMRKDWKQGLSMQSLIIYGATNKFSFAVLKQPILNTYPKISEVLNKLSKREEGSLAFSRDFGLAKKNGTINLCYRKYVVGTVEKDLLVLNNNNFFLDQHLKEAIHERA